MSVARVFTILKCEGGTVPRLCIFQQTQANLFCAVVRSYKLCVKRNYFFFFRFYRVGGSSMSLVQTVKVLASLLLGHSNKFPFSDFSNSNVGGWIIITKHVVHLKCY